MDEESSVTDVLSIPPTTLPSLLMTRVRERLFTPSPDMVYWHRLYFMKRVEGGLYMTTFICYWHLFKASQEKPKMLLSDRLKDPEWRRFG